jgi:hypothetical protein
VTLEVSEVIDRPVAAVFRFCADNHVRNHPRWDPDIELEQVSEGAMGVGTVIRRRNTRSGTPVEGTMEIVEYERDQAMGGVIREGPVQMRGRMTFDAVDENRTRLTISAEIPGLDESAAARIRSLMQRSADNIKRLVESET